MNIISDDVLGTQIRQCEEELATYQTMKKEGWGDVLVIDKEIGNFTKELNQLKAKAAKQDNVAIRRCEEEILSYQAMKLQGWGDRKLIDNQIARLMQQLNELKKAPIVQPPKPIVVEPPKLSNFEKWALEICPELANSRPNQLQATINTHRYAQTLTKARQFINSNQNSPEEIRAFLELKYADRDILPGFFDLMNKNSDAAKTLLIFGVRPQFKPAFKLLMTTPRYLECNLNFLKSRNVTERFFKLAEKNPKMLDLIPQFSKLAIGQYLDCLIMLEGNEKLIEPLHIFLTHLEGNFDALVLFFAYRRADKNNAEKLLLIAHRYPDVLKNNTHRMRILNWYDKNKDHPQITKLLHQLLTIFESKALNTGEEIVKIFEKKEIPQETAINLLDLASAGYSDLVHQMYINTCLGYPFHLNFYLKVASFARSTNATLIGKILSLNDFNDPLQNKIREMVLTTNPNQLETLKNIVEAYSENKYRPLVELYFQMDSLGKAATQEQHFLMECARSGHFSLMQYLHINSKDLLWDVIREKKEKSLPFVDALESLQKVLNASQLDQDNKKIFFKFGASLKALSGEEAALEQIGFMIHLIQINPQRFQKELFEKTNAVETQLWLMKAGEVDIQNLFRRCVGDDQDNKFSVEIPKLLISENGIVNKWLITPLLRKIGNSPHLNNVLNQLKESPQLSDKLLSVQRPNANAQQTPIVEAIQRTFKVQTPITETIAQRAVLSACLYPIRQANLVGSCFATSMAMQIQSNLGESISNLSELVHKGCLTRKVNGKSIDYFTLNRVPHRENENSIARAWEYTLASMAEAGEKDYYISFLAHLFSRNVQELWMKNIQLSVVDAMKERCRYVYDPTYFSGIGYGGWRLYDTKNQASPNQWKRIENLQQFRQFLKSTFNEVALTFIPNPTQAQNLAIGRQLAILDSDDFVKKFILALNKQPIENNNTSLEDCLRMKDTPWMIGSGGSTKGLIQAYTQNNAGIITSKVIGDTEAMRAKDMLLALETLPDAAVKQQSLIIRNQFHAFRVFPSCVKDLRELVNKLDNKSNPRTTPLLSNTLINMFNKECPGIQFMKDPKEIATHIVEDASLKEGSLMSAKVAKARKDIDAFQEVGIVSPYLINFGDNNYTGAAGMAWRHNLFNNTVEIRRHDIQSARPANYEIAYFNGTPFHLNFGPYQMV